MVANARGISSIIKRVINERTIIHPRLGSEEKPTIFNDFGHIQRDKSSEKTTLRIFCKKLTPNDKALLFFITNKIHLSLMVPFFFYFFQIVLKKVVSV